jgi:hypothetical protein
LRLRNRIEISPHRAKGPLGQMKIHAPRTPLNTQVLMINFWNFTQEAIGFRGAKFDVVLRGSNPEGVNFGVWTFRAARGANGHPFR